MKITLRKLNALQNLIQESVKTISVKTEISINEFQTPAEVDRARKIALDKISRREKLTNVWYDIRDLVSAANATSGISSLLTKAAQTDRRMGFLQEMIDNPVQTDRPVIEGKLEKIRSRKEDSHPAFGRDEVVTGVFTAEDMDDFKAQQRALKKSKQEINDKILELNVKTEVELSSEIQDVLKAENIL